MAEVSVSCLVSESPDGSRNTLNWAPIKGTLSTQILRNGTVIADLGRQTFFVDSFPPPGPLNYLVNVTVAELTASGLIQVGTAGFNNIVIETDATLHALEVSPGVWYLYGAGVGPQGPPGPEGPEGPQGPQGPAGAGGGGGGGALVVASSFLSASTYPDGLLVDASQLTVLASVVVTTEPALLTATASFDMTDAAGDIDIYLLPHGAYTAEAVLTSGVEEAALESATCTQSPNQTWAQGEIPSAVGTSDTQYDLVCYTTVAGFVASPVSESGGANATGITVTEEGT